MTEAPEPTPEPELGFVFVVTYGRSGSTLIQSLLNACPGYCIRGENADALGPMARLWAQVTGNPNLQSMRFASGASGPDHPWYGGEGIDPDALGRGLADLYVREVLRPPPGTRVTGCKEVRWGGSVAQISTALRFAMNFFPSARFVFNTRDHDQVAQSAWWADEPTENVRGLLESWEVEYDRFLSANPDRAVRLHYNDYVADHDALRPMYDLLAQDWDPDAVARIMARPLTHAKDG